MHLCRGIPHLALLVLLLFLNYTAIESTWKYILVLFLKRKLSKEWKTRRQYEHFRRTNSHVTRLVVVIVAWLILLLSCCSSSWVFSNTTKIDDTTSNAHERCNACADTRAHSFSHGRAIRIAILVSLGTTRHSDGTASRVATSDCRSFSCTVLCGFRNDGTTHCISAAHSVAD